jgi:hypothetical protein
LTEVAKQAKENSAVFQQISHKMYQELRDTQFELTASSLTIFSWQSFLILITTVLSVVSFFGMVLLWKKQKLLALTPTAIAMQQLRVGKTLAASTPKPRIILDYFKDASPKAVVAPSWKIELPHIEIDRKLDPETMLVIIVTIIFGLYMLRKIYRWINPSFDFKILLQIGNKHHRVNVILTAIPHYLQYYDCMNSQPMTPIVAVKGCLLPKLRLHRTNIEFSHKYMHVKFTLPEITSLTWIQAHRIRRLLNHQHYIMNFAQKPNQSWEIVPAAGSIKDGLNMQLPTIDRPSYGIYPTLARIA